MSSVLEGRGLSGLSALTPSVHDGSILFLLVFVATNMARAMTITTKMQPPTTIPAIPPCVRVADSDVSEESLFPTPLVEEGVEVTDEVVGCDDSDAEAETVCTHPYCANSVLEIGSKDVAPPNVCGHMHEHVFTSGAIALDT